MQLSAALLDVASAASAHSFSDDNGLGLQARSAKGLLHHLVRSLDEGEARGIVARYYDDELEGRLLSKRNFVCPTCGKAFVYREFLKKHMQYCMIAPAKKAPAKKGRK
ncbi:unnamed protein product [Clonostachys rosea f. rosea IK726]|uniref:Uncharacterized protein n=1 Tax=Clonostachys rosea f. rosea IK726 TaxID=1349383 RepID=A0ACA9TXK5_BIOOC|nr:unnamed protein product [Clonostachys rosea f. rosea IK726]